MNMRPSKYLHFSRQHITQIGIPEARLTQSPYPEDGNTTKQKRIMLEKYFFFFAQRVLADVWFLSGNLHVKGASFVCSRLWMRDDYMKRFKKPKYKGFPGPAEWYALPHIKCHGLQHSAIRTRVNIETVIGCDRGDCRLFVCPVCLTQRSRVHASIMTYTWCVFETSLSTRLLYGVSRVSLQVWNVEIFTRLGMENYSTRQVRIN